MNGVFDSYTPALQFPFPFSIFPNCIVFILIHMGFLWENETGIPISDADLYTRVEFSNSVYAVFVFSSCFCSDTAVLSMKLL